MHIYIVCFINGNRKGGQTSWHLAGPEPSSACQVTVSSIKSFPQNGKMVHGEPSGHANGSNQAMHCKKVRKKCRFFALNMRLPLSLIDWKHHVYQEAVGDVEPLVIQSVNMLRNNEFQEFFALPHGFPWVFHYHIMLHSTCNPRKTLVVSRRQWPSEAGNDEGFSANIHYLKDQQEFMWYQNYLVVFHRQIGSSSPGFYWWT